MSLPVSASSGFSTPVVFSRSERFECPQPVRRGFTLVELLVVIGIIALLISILLPALSAAQRQGRTIKCLSNLRQFGQAQTMYAGQNKNWAIPIFMGPKQPVDTRITWPNNNDLRQALKQPVWQQGNGYGNRYNLKVLCPEATQSAERENDKGAPIQFSYGYNVVQANIKPDPPLGGPMNTYRGHQITRIINPTAKLMMADALGANIERSRSNVYKNPAFSNYDEIKDEDDEKSHVAYRHNGNRDDRINVLFWDGHALTLHRSDVEAPNNTYKPFQTLWNPDKK